jgi:3',5'-cyclic AMP phosphodiesterase CpdA
MLIAQITDMHVVAEGELCGGVPTNDMLRAAVARLVDLRPRPDAVIATGDLVDHGTAAEYDLLRALLAPLPMPVFLIPGNHDERDALRAAFTTHRYLPHQGFLNYAIEDFPLRLVGLDTVAPGRPGGELCAARLSWLDRTLSAAAHPTLVFLHHPPFETGIWWMDAIGLTGRRQLEAIIRRHAHVEAVVAGHVHRPIARRWAGTMASIAPSTAHQVALDLAGDKFLTINREPPGLHLHLWRADAGLVTHLLPIAPVPGFVPPEHATAATMAETRAYFEAAGARLRATEAGSA